MTFIYFILVLGVTIFIHELGHFIFAKRAGIYVYEFSLGMGPKIFKFNRKNDETTYAIRLFPIGGFVQTAGEEIEEDNDIPSERKLQAKSWLQRFLTFVGGVLFNFILAIFLLFIVASVTGAPENKPYIESIEENYPAAKADLRPGDLIIKVNKTRVRSVDRLMLELQMNKGKTVTFEVKDESGKIKKIKITPKEEMQEDIKVYKYGFSIRNDIKKGVLPSIKFAFVKTYDLIEQMFFIILALFTGKLSLDNLAGPIGIYNIVGSTAKAGLINLVYLTGFLSINVGFINLLPIPAFDGGKILFLIIEKIKGSPVNPKVENIIHAIGFILLILLMILIIYNDILRLFK